MLACGWKVVIQENIVESYACEAFFTRVTVYQEQIDTFNLLQLVTAQVFIILIPWKNITGKFVWKLKVEIFAFLSNIQFKFSIKW